MDSVRDYIGIAIFLVAILAQVLKDTKKRRMSAANTNIPKEPVKEEKTSERRLEQRVARKPAAPRAEIQTQEFEPQQMTCRRPMPNKQSLRQALIWGEILKPKY